MHWIACLVATIMFAVLCAADPSALHFKPSSTSPQKCVTPCQLHSGASGCCPHRNGVCCSNRFHCCPMGSQCNLTSMQCQFVVQNSDQPPKVRVYSLLTRLDNTPHVDCGRVDSSGQHRLCPAATSCCGNSCCPFSRSQCCTDGQHCCPKGMQCGPNKTCRGMLGSTPSALSLPSFLLIPHREDNSKVSF